MPHSPLDVYGQYRFLDRGIFGTNHSKFLDEYAELERVGSRNGSFKKIVGYRNLEKLQSHVKSIGIVVDDSEQGLPETVDIKHSVKLDDKTKKIYKDVEDEFIANTKGGIITAANAGVKLLRLHQIASGLWKFENREPMRMSKEKIRALREVLEDLPKGEPVVIFTRFDKDTQDIQHYLIDKWTSSQLSGKRHELPNWKEGETQILVAQIQAAKEGIDLTRAAVAIFYSTGISLGDYMQCRKRLHRPPQKRMVRFIHLLASGTRDVSTMRALQERKDVVQAVLDEIRGEAS